MFLSGSGCFSVRIFVVVVLLCSRLCGARRLCSRLRLLLSRASVKSTGGTASPRAGTNDCFSAVGLLISTNARPSCWAGCSNQSTPCTISSSRWGGMYFSRMKQLTKFCVLRTNSLNFFWEPAFAHMVCARERMSFNVFQEAEALEEEEEEEKEEEEEEEEEEAAAPPPSLLPLTWLYNNAHTSQSCLPMMCLHTRQPGTGTATSLSASASAAASSSSSSSSSNTVVHLRAVCPGCWQRLHFTAGQERLSVRVIPTTLFPQHYSQSIIPKALFPKHESMPQAKDVPKVEEVRDH